MAVPQPALAQAAEAELVQRPWVELRTPSFRAFACGPTQELLSVVARLEQFRHTYSTLAGAQAVASIPILFFAFGDDRTFTPFKPLYEGQPKNVSGFFARGLEANFICLDLGRADRQTLETIYHEYTHLLLRRNAHYWPLWLEEGMADVYSTFEVNGANVLIGKPSAKRLRVLAREPMKPLAELFAVKHDSPEYNEQEHQGIFYSQSWLLAHYLVVGGNPALRTNFGHYNRLLREGQNETQAFTNAFRLSLAGMERELKNYLAQGKFEPIQIKAPLGGAARISSFTRPLAPAETAFWLGRLLLQLRRAPEAQRYFELAGRLDPRAPFGEEGLGLLAAERGQARQAVGHLEKAARLGSTSFTAYYQLGRQRLELAKNADGSLSRLAVAEAEAIRGSLKKALQLMPACAPAHNRLGYLEMVQDADPQAAERHLQMAAQLEPDNCAYVLMLGRYLVRLGKVQKARETLLDMSRLGSHPKCQAQAKELLALLPDASAQNSRRK